MQHRVRICTSNRLFLFKKFLSVSGILLENFSSPVMSGTAHCPILQLKTLIYFRFIFFFLNNMPPIEDVATGRSYKRKPTDPLPHTSKRIRKQMQVSEDDGTVVLAHADKYIGRKNQIERQKVDLHDEKSKSPAPVQKR